MTKNFLSFKFVALATGIAALATVSGPFFASAQTAPSQAALAATIRTAILQDSRSAGLSSAQIDSMVNALSAKAQAQGVTAQDIAYQAGTVGIQASEVSVEQSPTVVDQCSLSSGCSIGRAIGGGIARNPVYAALLLLSLMLMVVVFLMRKNPHLNGTIKRHEAPAIGGGI